jgi:hypothetical protein
MIIITPKIIVKRELATLRNTTDTETKGQLYGGITRITTEDALSLQELYCKNNEDKYGRKLFRDYQISDTTTCLLPDEVGVYRKIFPERLCDGTAGKFIQIIFILLFFV